MGLLGYWIFLLSEWDLCRQAVGSGWPRRRISRLRTRASVQTLCQQSPNIPPLVQQQAYYAHEVEISANSVIGAPLTLLFVTVYDRPPRKERETLFLRSRSSWLSLVTCFDIAVEPPTAYHWKEYPELKRTVPRLYFCTTRTREETELSFRAGYVFQSSTDWSYLYDL
jgi:hypothetical protein